MSQTHTGQTPDTTTNESHEERIKRRLMAVPGVVGVDTEWVLHVRTRAVGGTSERAVYRTQADLIDELPLDVEVDFTLTQQSLL